MPDHAPFVDGGIDQSNRVDSAWLNPVNNFVYQGKNPSFVTSTGSAAAQVVTLPTSQLTALAAGQRITFKAGYTNAAAGTLTVVGASSTSALPLKASQFAIPAGYIVAGDLVEVLYDAGAWNIVSINALTKRIYSNNYPSLQAALTAAVGQILVIVGTNNISAQLNLPLSGYITMEKDASIVLTVSELGLAIPSGANNLTLDGLIISGASSRAIFGTNISYVTIKNCDISGATLIGAGFTSAIFLDTATNCTVENNYCHGNGPGIHGGYGDITFYTGANTGNKILNNRCVSTLVNFNIICFLFSQGLIEGNFVSGANRYTTDNHGYGITIYATATYNRIIGNQVTNTQGTGIYLADSQFNTVAGNICINTAISQDDASLPVAAICLNSAGGAYNAVTGNVIYTSGKDGICVSSSSYDTISGNVISTATGGGIRLRGSGDYVAVSANTIVSCGIGINSDGSAKNGCNLSDNCIYTSGTYGIFISEANGAIISANTINASGRDGINLNVGTQSSITGNSIVNSSTSGANSYSGIVNSADYTSITSNTSVNTGATGQKYGIDNSGSYGTIGSNTLSKNQTAGLHDIGTAMTKSNNKLSIGAASGSAVLVGGTVTVNTVEVQTGDVITLTCTLAGGTQGIVATSTITAGTSFILTSSQGADTSTYAWKINH